MNKLNQYLEKLGELEFDLYRKDFLLSWEKSLDDLIAIITVAEYLLEQHRANTSCRIFDRGLAVSLFKDQSTRTRYGFNAAANTLGLSTFEFDEKKSQMTHGETEEETMVMLSFVTEIFGIRHDKNLGEGHAFQRKMSQVIQDAYKKNIIHQRPSIINLQSDLDHPTQTLADLLHLKNHFGSLEALKGKKIAVTWAYSPSYHKPQSVPQGLIALLSRFGLAISLAYPPSYDLLPDIIQQADSLQITHNMNDAVQNADIVYAKSWGPQLQNISSSDWEYNEEKMKTTHHGSALYMHCLPADISNLNCEHGEISSGIFNQFRNKLYHQASFKPFVIAAMMLLARCQDPITVLGEIKQRYV